MRIRLLFVAGSLLVLSAVAIGAVGISGSAGLPKVPGFANASGFGQGPGMMGGTGPGGVFGGAMGPGGMMGGYYGQPPASGQTISIDQAQEDVQQYLARYGNSDLKLNELVQFQDNFYAGITEKSTGVVAFALLVNPVTGAVGPEPGPNMMWNTKYGMAARGMMGAFGSSGAMTVSSEQAQKIAQQWLDANLAGTTANTPDRFYGFYTVDSDKGGQLAGMLSVNGSTGAVWYHNWHGGFIQEKQLAS
jgi:hypothetical protein